MGWGEHPDTLTIAIAQGYMKDCKHKPHSIEHLQAWHDADKKAAAGDKSAKPYLEGLLGEIKIRRNLDNMLTKGTEVKIVAD